MRRVITYCVAAMVLVLTASIPAQAAPGTLDPGFGGDGRVTTPFGSLGGSASSLVVQPDGKIVAVGTRGDGAFALARYRSDGSLDTTFGGDGKVTARVSGSQYSSANDAAIQENGRIVVVGRDFGRNTFVVTRFRSDGTLDPTFGNSGLVHTGGWLGRGSAAEAVAIQDNGKIVVGGSAATCGGDDTVLALARYRPDGTLDPTFDGDGRVTTTVGACAPDTVIRALATQPDGKIVAAGSAARDPVVGEPENLVLARYGRGGALDPTFGDQGIVKPDLGTSSGANDVVLDSHRRIVAAGFTCRPCRFTSVRYDTNGDPDPSFGTGGRADTTFRKGRTSAYGVRIQGDEAIVAAGETCAKGQCVFALARYLETGDPDPSFGGKGKVTTQFGVGSASASDVALQANGKIVAAGSACSAFRQCVFALTRYLP
jgi:uncharacterized delta-60 repeat protein